MEPETRSYTASGPARDAWESQAGFAGDTVVRIRLVTSAGAAQTRGFRSLQSFPPHSVSGWPSESASLGPPG